MACHREVEAASILSHHGHRNRAGPVAEQAEVRPVHQRWPLTCRKPGSDRASSMEAVRSGQDSGSGIHQNRGLRPVPRKSQIVQANIR